MNLKKTQLEKITAGGGRIFEREKDEQTKSQTAFAVCLETDDEELLIPLKIYEVAVAGNGYVGVVDEAGEKTVYPPNFFLLLEVSADAAKRLEQIALAERNRRQETVLAT